MKVASVSTAILTFMSQKRGLLKNVHMLLLRSRLAQFPLPGSAYTRNYNSSLFFRLISENL